VLDPRGVPSVAKVVWLAPDSLPDSHGPAITAPGDRSDATRMSTDPLLSVTNSASDPDGGDTLTWAAAGLPVGMPVNATTGTVSGRPTRVGEYNVVLSVVDTGGNSANANFTWTITGPEPLTFDPLPAVTAATTGQNVAFTANANGTGVQYKW